MYVTLMGAWWWEFSPLLQTEMSVRAGFQHKWSWRKGHGIESFMFVQGETLRYGEGPCPWNCEGPWNSSPHYVENWKSVVMGYHNTAGSQLNDAFWLSFLYTMWFHFKPIVLIYQGLLDCEVLWYFSFVLGPLHMWGWRFVIVVILRFLIGRKIRDRPIHSTLEGGNLRVQRTCRGWKSTWIPSWQTLDNV